MRLLCALAACLLARPGLAAPSKLFDGMPDRVSRAFSRGDAAAFLEAARAADYLPPASDDAQTRLYAEGVEREQAERAVHGLLHPGRKNRALDLPEFGRRLGDNPGLDLRPHRHIEAKMAILKGSGYTHLRGGLPIERAGPRQISNVFLTAYRAYQRARRH